MPLRISSEHYSIKWERHCHFSVVHQDKLKGRLFRVKMQGWNTQTHTAHAHINTLTQCVYTLILYIID